MTRGRGGGTTLRFIWAGGEGTVGHTSIPWYQETSTFDHRYLPVPVLLLLVLVDCYTNRGIAKGIVPREAHFTSCVCVFQIALWELWLLERLERRQSRVSELQERAAIMCDDFRLCYARLWSRHSSCYKAIFSRKLF